jgi:hypothetical protein
VHASRQQQRVCTGVVHVALVLPPLLLDTDRPLSVVRSDPLDARPLLVALELRAQFRVATVAWKN